MTRRDVVSAAAGVVAGLVVASAAWSLQKPATQAKADPVAAGAGGDDIESLRTANAHLVESLAEADKTIASLREQLGSSPSKAAAPEERAANEDAGRGGRRR